jgi:hypothetical protein
VFNLQRLTLSNQPSRSGNLPNVSDVELEAASSLAQMNRKKAKKLLRRLLLLKFNEFLPPSMMISSRNLTNKVFPLGVS